ncbi:hypothetical protein IJJ39_00090 [Candidatus Saccharibacteria bacterium]|nr:hypothetical protein [Candidatus Saccharibacteria bacterium]
MEKALFWKLGLIKKICVLPTLVALIGIMSSTPVWADGWYGTGSGSGGVKGCNSGALHTCYGATWKQYDIDKALNGEYYGMEGIGGDTLRIQGRGKDTYAATRDINFSTCKSGGATKFWRYAMVASKDFTYYDVNPAVTVEEGKQVGLVGINGNSTSVYDSEYFSGKMNYIATDASWGNVMDFYEDYRRAWQRITGETALAWGETDSNGGIAWFCDFSEDQTNAYYARSNVSNSEVGGYSSTGIVGSGLTTVYTTDARVYKDSTATITFSHDIYSLYPSNNVSWSVDRSSSPNSLGSTSNYTVNMTYSRQGPSPVNLNLAQDSFYMAQINDRPGVSGDDHYIARDVYDITFKNTGTYTFCEMIKVDGANLTKVCSRVVVTNDGGSSSGGGSGGGGGGGYGSLPGSCSSFGRLTAGVTQVISKVINQGNSERTLTNYHSGWQDVVYAMPTDVIGWRDCYYPGAQAYAQNVVSKFMSWDGHAGHICANTWNAEKTMTKAFYDQFNINWTNQFRITTSSRSGFNNLNLNTSGPLRYPSSTLWQTYTNGDTQVRSVEHNYQIKRTNDVGESFEDTIYTPGTPITSSWYSDGRHGWTICTYDCGGSCCCGTGCSNCGRPCCRYFSHSNNYNTGSASIGARNDDSSVIVPYNFNNNTNHTVSSTNSLNVAYAGETIRVSNTQAIIGERYNNEVQATYTTQVDNAEVRLIGYVTTSANINNASFTRDGNHNTNLCSWLPQKQCVVEETTGVTTLNRNGDLHGHIDAMGWDKTYNVFDASAGDYMCFVMAIYPASSGPQYGQSGYGVQWDRITSSVGDGKWRVSAPKCIQIAKRPSIQILGGDLYVGGSAQTSVSTKQQLYGVSGYGYLPTSRSSVVVNGSWVEEGIVAAGKVSGLSSGASLGYVNENENRRNSGGLNYTKFCETRVPLSIANYTTVSNELRDGICPKYDFIGSSDIQSVVKNRAALASYWGSGTDATNVYIGDDSGKAIPSATGKDIRVVESGSNVTIRDGALYSNMMRVVKTSGDVTINGNIENYGDGMTSSGEVPKAVIYAKNIYINCYVERIDAVLIAENKIVTCNGYEGNNDINSAARSNRLIINGVVMANKIDFGRTFGNSVGNGSGEPAEIINYDTTTLLWGRYMAGSAESDTLTVTYQHELAPRY